MGTIRLQLLVYVRVAALELTLKEGQARVQPAWQATTLRLVPANVLIVLAVRPAMPTRVYVRHVLRANIA